MTRSELIEALKQEFSNLPASYVENAVHEVFDLISDALSEGKRAEFRGFGAFGSKERAPRQGRNPRTGSKVEVKAKVFPFFKCSRSLLQRLNKW